MNPVKVLLVDDHEEFRRVVHDFLSRLPQVTVVGEASDGEEAIRQVQKLHPDFVLMDVSMPHLDGLSATRIIKKGWPETRVFITTALDGEAYRLQASAAQADGFLPKAELKRGLEAAFGVSSSSSSSVVLPKSSHETT